jgi:hypothetical protein
MSYRLPPAPTTESPLWMTMERVQAHTWALTVEHVSLVLSPTHPEIYLAIRGVPSYSPTSGVTPSGLPLWEVKRG